MKLFVTLFIIALVNKSIVCTIELVDFKNERNFLEKFKESSSYNFFENANLKILQSIPKEVQLNYPLLQKLEESLTKLKISNPISTNDNNYVKRACGNSKGDKHFNILFEIINK